MSDNPFRDDPYASPQDPLKPAVLDSTSIPPVWLWYKAYCVFMALLYLCCLAGGFLLLKYKDDVLPPNPAPGDVVGLQIQSAALTIMGAALTLLYIVALILPRNKLNWIVGFITIGIGLTSCCCMPATIPLLIYWLKDETRFYLNAM